MDPSSCIYYNINAIKSVDRHGNQDIAMLKKH